LQRIDPFLANNHPEKPIVSPENINSIAFFRADELKSGLCGAGVTIVEYETEKLLFQPGGPVELQKMWGVREPLFLKRNRCGSAETQAK